MDLGPERWPQLSALSVCWVPGSQQNWLLPPAPVQTHLLAQTSEDDGHEPSSLAVNCCV